MSGVAQAIACGGVCAASRRGSHVAVASIVVDVAIAGHAARKASAVGGARTIGRRGPMSVGWGRRRSSCCYGGNGGSVR